MRFIVARHAETVYNAAARMQGQMAHTPLTRAGIAQAEAMGEALAGIIAPADPIDLWASPAGRTQQTAAIIAEHLGRDYFAIRTDPRLLEIDVGDWQGRLYAEIIAEQGEIVDGARRLFSVRPPNGESYPDIEVRLRSWLADLAPDRDALVISHGMTLRVLRGLLAGGEAYAGTTIADDGLQGTIFQVEDGHQTILHQGRGTPHRAGVA
ncbi:MAG: histidine phosphatase family protein [Sphingomicrobium sp.]